MDWIALTPRIRYLPAGEAPLSAEVGLIQGDGGLWLFDLGASQEAAEAIRALPRRPRAVISHFHPDHMANLARLEPEDLYVGPYTREKAGQGTAVRQPMTFQDGAALRVFPLPSCHARGSLGLEVDGTYAFLGDGVYSTVKRGRPCYNATLLKDTITVIRGLSAPWLLLSHGQPFLQKKTEVLAMLEAVYARRDPAKPEIYLEEQ